MSTMTEEDVDLSDLIDEDNKENHFKRNYKDAPLTPPGSIAQAECGVLYRVKGETIPGDKMFGRFKELCPNCVAAVMLR